MADDSFDGLLNNAFGESTETGTVYSGAPGGESNNSVYDIVKDLPNDQVYSGLGDAMFDAAMSGVGVPDPEMYDPENIAATDTSMRLTDQGSFDEDGNLLYLNVFGNRWDRERLESSEYGRDLMDLAHLNREGRAGFWDAAKRGGFFKLVPYINDVHSVGLSVKETVEVHNIFKKMDNREPLSDDERLKARLYLARGDREAEQTGWGMFGGIVSAMPAFAGEIATSAGLGIVAKKIATKGMKHGVISGSTKFMRRVGQKLIKERLKSKITREGMEKGIKTLLTKNTDELAELVFKKGVRDKLDDAAKGALSVFDDVLKETQEHALKYATIANKGPLKAVDEANVLRNAGEYVLKSVRDEMAMTQAGFARKAAYRAHDYLIKGLMDGLDPNYQLGTGMRSALRRAAGITYRGSVYGGGMLAVDEAVHTALAPVFGVDRIVTPNELSLTASGTLSGNDYVVDNARWLSMGMRWAEYMSEMTGPAIGAVGGAAARKIGGTAVAAPLKKAHGKITKHLDHIARGSRLRNETLASLSGKSINEVSGKQISEVAGDMATARLLARGVKQAGGDVFEKEVARATAEIRKALNIPVVARALGLFINKTGLGPEEFEKMLKRVGYDGVMEEIGEEAVNGFVQGILGLNDSRDRSFGARLDNAISGAGYHLNPMNKDFWIQAAAFALPAVARRGLLHAQTHLLQGTSGEVREFVMGADELTARHGHSVIDKTVKSEDGRDIVFNHTTPFRSGDNNVLDEAERSARGDAASPGGEVTASDFMFNAPRFKKSIRKLAAKFAPVNAGAVSPGRRGVAFLLQTINGMINGRPFMGFTDPIGSLADRHDIKYGNHLRMAGLLYNMHLNQELKNRFEINPGSANRGQIEQIEKDPEFQKSVGTIIDSYTERFLEANGVRHESKENVDDAVERIREDNKDMSYEEAQREYIRAYVEVSRGEISEESLPDSEIDRILNIAPENKDAKESQEAREKYRKERADYAARTGMVAHRDAQSGVYTYATSGVPHKHDSLARKIAYQRLSSVSSSRVEIPLRGNQSWLTDLPGIELTEEDVRLMEEAGRFPGDTDIDRGLARLYDRLGLDVSAMANPDTVQQMRFMARVFASVHDILGGRITLESNKGNLIDVVRTDSGYRIVDRVTGEYKSAGVYKTASEAAEQLSNNDETWTSPSRRVRIIPAVALHSPNPLDVYMHVSTDIVEDVFRSNDPDIVALFGKDILRALITNRPGTSEHKEAVDELMRVNEITGLAARAEREGVNNLSEAQKKLLYSDKALMHRVLGTPAGYNIQSSNARRKFRKIAAGLHGSFDERVGGALRNSRIGQSYVVKSGTYEWVARPGAYNSPTEGLVIPFEDRTNVVSVIEDIVELIYKPNIGHIAYRRTAPGESGRRLGTAAAFMRRRVLELVKKKKEALEPDSPLRRDYNVIESAFRDPMGGDEGNIEMFSKFMVAVVLQESSDDNVGYPALTAMGDEIRNDLHAYPAFVALLDALMGGYHMGTYDTTAPQFNNIRGLIERWSRTDAERDSRLSDIAVAEELYTAALGDADAGKTKEELSGHHPWDRVAELMSARAESAAVVDRSIDIPKETGLNTIEQREEDKETSTRETEPPAPSLRDNKPVETEPADEGELETTESIDEGGEEMLSGEVTSGPELNPFGSNSIMSTIASNPALARGMTIAAYRMMRQDQARGPWHVFVPDEDKELFRLKGKTLNEHFNSLTESERLRVVRGVMRILSNWDQAAMHIGTDRGMTLQDRFLKSLTGADFTPAAEPLAYLGTGSGAKLEALERADVYQLFRNLVALTTMEYGDRNTTDPVVRMRDAVIDIDGLSLSKALDSTKKYQDTKSNPFDNPDEFRKLVAPLLELGEDGAPTPIDGVDGLNRLRLYALGVSLDVAGPIQGAALLGYLRTMSVASMVSLEAPAQDGKDIDESDPPVATVGVDMITPGSTYFRVREAHANPTVSDTDTGRTAANHVTGALSRAARVGKDVDKTYQDILTTVTEASFDVWGLVMGYPMGDAPSPSTLRTVDPVNALSYLRDTIRDHEGTDTIIDKTRDIREALASAYEGLYGGYNRVSESLRDDRVLRGMLTGYSKFSRYEKKAYLVNNFRKNMSGLITGLFRGVARMHELAPVMRDIDFKNEATSASAFNNLSAALGGEINHDKRVSKYIKDAKRLEYRTAAWKRDKGSPARVTGNLGSVPAGVIQLADNLGESAWSAFGADRETGMLNMKRNGRWPDGTPVISVINAVNKKTGPRQIAPVERPGEVSFIVASRLFLEAQKSQDDIYVPVPMYSGTNRRLAINIPAALTKERVVNGKRAKSLAEFYDRFLVEMIPMLLDDPRHHGRRVLASHMHASVLGSPMYLGVVLGTWDPSINDLRGIDDRLTNEALNGSEFRAGDQPSTYAGAASKITYLGPQHHNKTVTQYITSRSEDGTPVAAMKNLSLTMSTRAKRASLTDQGGAKVNRFIGSHAPVVHVNGVPMTLGQIIYQGLNNNVPLVESKKDTVDKDGVVTLSGDDVKRIIESVIGDSGTIKWARRDGDNVPAKEGVLEDIASDIHIDLLYHTEGEPPQLIVGSVSDGTGNDLLSATLGHPTEASYIPQPIPQTTSSQRVGVRSSDSADDVAQANMYLRDVVREYELSQIAQRPGVVDITDAARIHERERLIDALSMRHPLLAEIVASGGFIDDRELREAAAQILSSAEESKYTPRVWGARMVHSASGDLVITDPTSVDVTLPLWDNPRVKAYPMVQASTGETVTSSQLDPYLEYAEVFTEWERDHEFNGLERRVSLVRANFKFPGARNALFLYEDHPDLVKAVAEARASGDKRSQDSIMVDLFGKRLMVADGIMRNDTEEAYLKYVRRYIAPLVMTPEGKSLFCNRDGVELDPRAVAEGATVSNDVSDWLDENDSFVDAELMDQISFADLVIPDPSGVRERIFDRAAIYYDHLGGSDGTRPVRNRKPMLFSKKGQRGIMVAGSLFYGERVPSGSFSPGAVMRMSLPAHSDAPTPQSVRGVYDVSTGKVKRVLNRRAREMSPENIIEFPPEMALLAGWDNDGDEMTIFSMRPSPRSGAIFTGAPHNNIIEYLKSGWNENDAVNEVMTPAINRHVSMMMADRRNLPVARSTRTDQSNEYIYTSAPIMNREVRYSYLFADHHMPITATVFDRPYLNDRFKRTSPAESLSDMYIPEGVESIISPSRSGDVSHIRLGKSGKSIRSTRDYFDRVNAMYQSTDDVKRNGVPFVQAALFKPTVKLNQRDAAALHKRADDVVDADAARGVTVNFLSTLGMLHKANAWSLVRPGVDAPTDDEFNRLLNWAERIENLTFDEEKESMFSRAGFTKNNISKYLAGLLARNWKSAEELHAYHDMWLLLIGTASGRAEVGGITWPSGDKWGKVRDVYDKAKTEAKLIRRAVKHIPDGHRLLNAEREIEQRNTMVHDRVKEVAEETAEYERKKEEAQKNGERVDDIPVPDRVFITRMQNDAVLEKMERLRLMRKQYEHTTFTSEDYLAYLKYTDRIEKQIRTSPVNSSERRKAIQAKQMLRTPTEAKRSIEHTHDILAGMRFLYEADGPLYAELIEKNVSDQEFILMVNVAWKAFMERGGMPVDIYSTQKGSPIATDPAVKKAVDRLDAGPIRSLFSNRMLHSLDFYTTAERAIIDGEFVSFDVMSSGLVGANIDLSSDIDAARLDFDRMANTDARTEISISRGSKVAGAKITITLRNLANMMVLYNALTSESATIQSTYNGGFGYLLSESSWDKFTRLRTNSLRKGLTGDMFLSAISRAPRGKLDKVGEALDELESAGYTSARLHPGKGTRTKGVSTYIQEWDNNKRAPGKYKNIAMHPDAGTTNSSMLRSTNISPASTLDYSNPVASVSGGFLLPAEHIMKLVPTTQGRMELAPERSRALHASLARQQKELERINELIPKRKDGAVRERDAISAEEINETLNEDAGESMFREDVDDYDPEDEGYLDMVNEDISVELVSTSEGREVERQLNKVGSHVRAENRINALSKLLNNPHITESKRAELKEFLKEAKAEIETTESLPPRADESFPEGESTSQLASGSLSSDRLYKEIMGNDTTPKHTGKEAIDHFRHKKNRHKGDQSLDRTTITTARESILPYTGPEVRQEEDYAKLGSEAHEMIAEVFRNPEKKVDDHQLELIRQAMLTRFPLSKYHYIAESKSDIPHAYGDTSLEVGGLFGIADLVLINKNTGEYIIVDHKTTKDPSQYNRRWSAGDISEKDKRMAQVLTLNALMNKLGFKSEKDGLILNYDLTEGGGPPAIDEVTRTVGAVKLAFLISGYMDLPTMYDKKGQIYMGVRSEFNMANESVVTPADIDTAPQKYDVFFGMPDVPVTPHLKQIKELFYAARRKETLSERIESEEAMNALVSMAHLIIHNIGYVSREGRLPRARALANMMRAAPMMRGLVEPRTSSWESVKSAMITIAHQSDTLRKRLRSINAAGDMTADDAQALDELGRLISAMHGVQRTMMTLYRDYGQDGRRRFSEYYETVLNRKAPPRPVIEAGTERIELSTPAYDPYTGAPDITEDQLLRRLITEPRHIRETLMPMFRGVGMRSLVQTHALEAVATSAVHAADNFTRTYGTLDGKHLTMIDTEGDGGTRFIYNPETGENIAVRPGDEGYPDASDIASMSAQNRIKMVNHLKNSLNLTEGESDILMWYSGHSAYSAAAGDRCSVTGVPVIINGFVDKNMNRAMPRGRDLRSISANDSARMAQGLRSGKSTSLHVMVTRAYDTLPEPLFKKFINVLANSLDYNALIIEQELDPGLEVSGADMYRHSQMVLAELRKKDWVRATQYNDDTLVDSTPGDFAEAVISVPVTEAYAAFKGHKSLQEKLKKSGRGDIDYSPEALGQVLRSSFNDLYNRALGSVPMLMGADDFNRMFRLRGIMPVEPGGGVYRAFNTALVEKHMQSTEDAIRELGEDFDEVMEAQHDRKLKQFREIPVRQVELFKNLVGGDAKQAGNKEVWKRLLRGEYSKERVPADASISDLSKAIYRLALRRLADNAITSEEPGVRVTAYDSKGARLGDIIETLRRRAARYRWDVDMSAMTPSQAFEAYGMLPSNMTGAELLQAHALDIAAKLKFIHSFNAALMQSNHLGQPINFASPSTISKDNTIVSDSMWEALARWWSESESLVGAKYDPSLTGRENAQKMFAELENLSTTLESVRTVRYADDPHSGGKETHFRLITNTGFQSVNKILVRLATPGDDSESWGALRTGGENVAWMHHLLGARALEKPGGLASFLNWWSVRNKAMAMSLNLFHIVATGGESQAAAAGITAAVAGTISPEATRRAGGTKVGKGLGLRSNTVTPRDIARVLLTNDPWLVELKQLAAVMGMPLSDSTGNNSWDMDKHVIRKDVNRLLAMAEQSGVTIPKPMAKAISASLYGLQEAPMEWTFETIINSIKLAVAANTVTKLREEARAAGKWWDPIRDLRRRAPAINAEVGNIDPAMYPWLTPKSKSFWRLVLLSHPWTMGAWEAAGGGALTEKFFGFRLHPDVERKIPLRWLRMYGGIMFGVPLVAQMSIRGLFSRYADPEKDKWFIWQNEIGRRTSFNLEPALKAMAAAPGVRWAKDNIPMLGKYIPAAMGDDPTFGDRMQYMHFGKQGWEILRWFMDGPGALFSKLNLPIQRSWIAFAGSAPNSEFDMPFKGKGWAESLVDRTKYLLSGMKPLSYASMDRNKDAGFLAMLGPVTKGTSATGAAKAIESMFRAYSRPKYYDNLRQSPHYWTDVPTLAREHLLAAEANGHNPDKILLDAQRPILRDLYRTIYQSLPNRQGGKVKERELGEAMASLHRMNFVYDRLLRSIKDRDERNKGKIDLTAEVMGTRDYYLREAFWYPDGRYNKKKRMPNESNVPSVEPEVLGEQSGNAFEDYLIQLLDLSPEDRPELTF